MRVGSLFAGIGGFDLGLERAGFEIAWQVEIDPYCQRVLAKHWPHVARYGDIKAINWATLEPVDLMCGGFPCQPFSLAGQRRGTADDRYLWPAMLSGIQQLQPTWIIGENVPGLVGPVLDTVLSDLEAAGYEVGTLAVPACAVDAPHIRQRIWILAHSRRLSHNGRRCECRGSEESGACDRTTRSSEHPKHVADADGAREPQSKGHEQAQRGWIVDGCEDVADAQRERRQAGAERSGRTAGANLGRRSAGSSMADANSQQMGRSTEPWGECRRWEPEPELGRVAHGIPHRVDRLRGLGNAIVPHIAEWLGRQIMKVTA